MDLSVVIVSHNTESILKKCLDSLFSGKKLGSFEVIVVDNASTDSSAEMLRQYSRREKRLKCIFSPENKGFSAGNNKGQSVAKGDFILYLNSDTIVDPKVLEEMLLWMRKHPKVGIASCSLLNSDGSLQGTGGYFPTLPRVFSWMTIQDLPFVDRIIKPFHPMKPKSPLRGGEFFTNDRELDWVTGAFMLMRREVVDAVGEWDEDYFMYTEEVDFCYRAKKLGWIVWFSPQWSIIHIGGASGTTKSSILAEYRSVARFYTKHYPRWQYPLLRLFLKIGALGRIVIFGILEGSESARVYVDAFREA